MTRDSWAHIYTQSGLWNPSPGWTLFHSGVARGERWRAGMGLLIAPQLSHPVLEFSAVNDRVVSLRPRIGKRSLTVVLAYKQQCRVPGLPGGWGH